MPEQTSKAQLLAGVVGSGAAVPAAAATVAGSTRGGPRFGPRAAPRSFARLMRITEAWIYIHTSRAKNRH
jgi:hypothetical protein